MRRNSSSVTLFHCRFIFGSLMSSAASFWNALGCKKALSSFPLPSTLVPHSQCPDRAVCSNTDPTTPLHVVVLSVSLSNGGQSSTGAASQHRSVSRPEARHQRPYKKRPCFPIQKELSAKLHPEYLLLHRPARPPRLHHGGWRRRALLQHHRDPGHSTDGGGQWGQSLPF